MAMADFSESLYIIRYKGSFFGSCPFILGKKQENEYFFEKSCPKIWWNQKNVVPLHPQFRNDAYANKDKLQ